ncbi:MAG: DegQ family serine endoprotease [Methylococcales bacterium]|nr:DegQ family serine endoprotease [Methylococcales bacterium]
MSFNLLLPLTLRVFLLLLFMLARPVAAELPDFTDMVKNHGPAVVNISTTKRNDLPDTNNLPQMPDGVPPELEDLFKHFFRGQGGMMPRETSSLGSGFIISTDGYVLTNHHVVNNADEIIVRLNDRRELEAELIGSDEQTDIALLKIEANNLPTVDIGDAKNLKVGEWVLAIGSPFGFEQSVTAGIVSAKGRSLPNGNYVPFIQTDVAINPGNSGGPLFNMNGEVVGINSQIYSRTGGFMGLSFAIPMDVAMNVVKQIKSQGKVSRGWLGVQIQDVTRELAESFGMKRPVGALVAKVIKDSPADQAGIEIGDIIVEFNGTPVETSGDLPPMVGMTEINSRAILNIIRQGDDKRLSVTIGLLPDQQDSPAPGKSPPQSSNRLGLEVTDLTDEQREQLQVIKNGVLVRSVKAGPALNAGIQAGDVILRIGNQVIGDSNDFAKIVSQLPADKAVAVLIQRRGNPIFLAFKIDK